MKKRLTVIILSLITVSCLQAASTPPNDASVASDLVLWLRDPVNNMHGGTGTWHDVSGNGFDANPVGLVAGSGITYEAASVGALQGNDVISNNVSLASFGEKIDDMLATVGLNSDSGLSDLTILTVYHIATAASKNDELSNIRPVGFGSTAADGVKGSDLYNLGIDPSIRKDNGKIGLGAYSEPHPMQTLFIRVSRMDSATGNITEWFNAGGSFNKVLETAESFTASTDKFYLGDLRGGVTPSIGGTWAESDFGVAEVAVYKSALTDAQVADIAQWLQSNAGLPLKPVVTVTETGGDTVVSEWTPGVSDSFTVELTSAPASSVTVTISAGGDDPNDADLRPNSQEVKLNGNPVGSQVDIIFDGTNWNQPKTVQVTADDDADEERLQTAVLSIVSSSSDPAFDGGGGMVVPVTIIDNDAADLDITETDDSTQVWEEGATSDMFDVNLSVAPSSDVTVRLTELDADPNDLVISPAVIVFTAANYNVPKTVTVTAVDDDLIETEIEDQLISFEITTDDTEYQLLDKEMSVQVLDNECGATGYNQKDFNEDCIVDLLDFAEFAAEWLKCTYPNDPQCE